MTHVKPRWQGISICVVVTVLSLFIFFNLARSQHSAFVFLNNVEALSLDARFQFRGPVQPSTEIVIVAIDQKTIDQLGWPFERSHYARMLRTLTADGARVVGFDEVFPFPDQASSDNDRKFAQAMLEANNVILGYGFLDNPTEVARLDQERIRRSAETLAFQAYPQLLRRSETEGTDFDPYGYIRNYAAVEPNLPIFADAARSYGAFNMGADSDGVFRQAPLIFQYIDPAFPPGENVAFYPSLDVEIARLYMGADEYNTKVWFGPVGLEEIELGDEKIYPDISGTVSINYAGPSQSYPYYSFADVADGLTPQGTFRDKIVLVGATAVGIGDIRSTPFEKQGYPGVEIHANVVDNILQDKFLRRGFREEITDLEMLLFLGLVMGVVFVRVHPLISTILYGLTLPGLLVFVYYQFAANGRWLSLLLPASTLSLSYMSIMIWRFGGK